MRVAKNTISSFLQSASVINAKQNSVVFGCGELTQKLSKFNTNFDYSNASKGKVSKTQSHIQSIRKETRSQTPLNLADPIELRNNSSIKQKLNKNILTVTKHEMSLGKQSTDQTPQTGITSEPMSIQTQKLKSGVQTTDMLREAADKVAQSVAISDTRQSTTSKRKLKLPRPKQFN